MHEFLNHELRLKTRRSFVCVGDGRIDIGYSPFKEDGEEVLNRFLECLKEVIPGIYIDSVDLDFKDQHGNFNYSGCTYHIRFTYPIELEGNVLAKCVLERDK